MFAPIYECPKCGDVWHGVSIVEDIDCDRDSVAPVAVCVCGSEVSEKVVVKHGERIPVWHPLTYEEMLFEEEFEDGS